MQRKALNLLIALYITGCGAAEKARDGAGAPSPPSATAKATQAQPEASAPAEEAIPVSLAVADQAALPACAEKTEGALAYVKAEHAFYGCAGKGWEAIDIKGKDGVDGKNGQDGAAGKDGADGEIVTANQWYDQMTGQRWTTAAQEVTWVVAQTVCTAPWRLPTEAELELAFARGMTVDHPSIWAASGRAGKAGSGFNSPQRAVTNCVEDK